MVFVKTVTLIAWAVDVKITLRIIRQEVVVEDVDIAAPEVDVEMLLLAIVRTEADEGTSSILEAVVKISSPSDDSTPVIIVSKLTRAGEPPPVMANGKQSEKVRPTRLRRKKNLDGMPLPQLALLLAVTGTMLLLKGLRVGPKVLLPEPRTGPKMVFPPLVTLL